VVIAHPTIAYSRRPQASAAASAAFGGGGNRDPKKAGEIVEIALNQKDGTQIAPGRSPLKDLSVCGGVGDLTAVSDGYGKSDAHLPRFFSVSVETAISLSTSLIINGFREMLRLLLSEYNRELPEGIRVV
jgi:hypothetical protein